MLNLLEDPHIDLLYIYFLNLTLIHPTLNPNFPLTVIYIHLFINGWWVQWQMMGIEGKWSWAIVWEEDEMKQSLKHLKTQSL
jgi:hypothetical protein